MPEPTHALRHHLRCAADRAIASAVAEAEARQYEYSCPGAVVASVWVGITGFKNLPSGTQETRAGFAEVLELYAGLLLRAAVWLRRSG